VFNDVDSSIIRQKREMVIILTTATIVGKSEFKCQIVYVGDDAIQDVHFYGKELI